MIEKAFGGSCVRQIFCPPPPLDYTLYFRHVYGDKILVRATEQEHGKKVWLGASDPKIRIKLPNFCSTLMFSLGSIRDPRK